VALPDSITTRTVVGTFLDLDGDPIVGAEIMFRPSPARLLAVDEPAVILPGRVTVATDADGQISVDLATTDDEALNPVDWTWSVRIDIPRTQWAAQPYAFAFELPADVDPLDLNTVTPVSASGGVPIIQGPPGPPGLEGTGGVIGGSVVDGQIIVNVATPWGIDPDTGPYFDPNGAQPGEEAVLQFDPDTGTPVLILIGGA